MSTDSRNRTADIIRAFGIVFADRNVRELDAMAAFGDLATRIPNLTFEDLNAAADEAKKLASEIRALAWRVQTAAENDRRRGASPR
jgi:hypothetical protein